MIKIDSNLILKLIPHRDPFLFIETAEILEEGILGKGYKKFLNTEYFFKGHFPNMPIVPGVVLIEALAQTAGIVVSHKLKSEKNKSVLFMSVSKAKFRSPVKPNDNIIFEVSLLNKVRSVYKFQGSAFNQKNIKVCESEFSAMITSDS
jgi:3-hydroxyacyl-[acyl-carrier-protein] dehydratase|tara:strand:+ start:251 stop:694 length:444 start_codon:yes stop_codon:yes gene_type:complete